MNGTHLHGALMDNEHRRAAGWSPRYSELARKPGRPRREETTVKSVRVRISLASEIEQLIDEMRMSGERVSFNAVATRLLKRWLREQTRARRRVANGSRLLVDEQVGHPPGR